MEVISLVQKGVPRYATEDLAVLPENAMRVEKKDYSRINAVALIHHSANLRSSTLVTMLSEVGADQAWSQALRATDFLGALRGLRVFPVLTGTRCSFLTTFARVGTDIAHGGGINQTLDETYQLAYLKGLRALGKALSDALFAHAFEPGSTFYRLVGTYVERFRERIVVLIAEAATLLEEGDVCMVLAPDGSRLARVVVSIELNNERQKSVLTVGGGAELGVQFDARVGRKAQVFVRRAASA